MTYPHIQAPTSGIAARPPVGRTAPLQTFSALSAATACCSRLRCHRPSCRRHHLHRHCHHLHLHRYRRRQTHRRRVSLATGIRPSRPLRLRLPLYRARTRTTRRSTLNGRAAAVGTRRTLSGAGFGMIVTSRQTQCGQPARRDLASAPPFTSLSSPRAPPSHPLYEPTHAGAVHAAEGSRRIHHPRRPKRS